MYVILFIVLAFGSIGCKTAGKVSAVKLIGGSPVSAEDFPSTLQLLKPRPNNPDPDYVLGAACTAALIAPRYILTASHCVVEPGGDPYSGQPIVRYLFGAGELIKFAVGPKAERLLQNRVKAVYVRPETVVYLIANKGYEMKTIESANDIAVIELADNVAGDIPVAHLSAAKISTGSNFRYGGYGCESNVNIPGPPAKDAQARDYGPYGTRLKSTQAQVSSSNGVIAEGPTYDKETLQSGCPGDSGGPIYFDANPSSPKPTGISEIIGVLSYGRSPGEVPGKPATEVGFSIVTEGSVLGSWVTQVIAGQQAVSKDIRPAACINPSSAYGEAYCGSGNNANANGSLTSSCSLVNHSTIQYFPSRKIIDRECLSKNGERYVDPHGILTPYRFAKVGPPVWQDTQSSFALFASNWTTSSGYVCFEGVNGTTANLQRLAEAIMAIDQTGADPLKNKLPFLKRTSTSYAMKSVQYDSATKTILVEVVADGSSSQKYRIGACEVDYGN